MFYTIAWAILVIIYYVAATINYRIAYGPAREVDLEDEVVLITGGSGGLGGLIAEVYGLRGVSVAVLDVKRPQGEEIEGVEYYHCDTSNIEDVQKTKALVEKDLGHPTIIINCAAAPINGSSFLELSSEAFLHTINATFIGAVNTFKTFLPGLIASETGGTIVTVSSVLAHFCPANLSDYAASKAALSALHTSLTMELRQAGHTSIKTVLVEPGQLGTALFGRVETPSWFLAPVLETREVAKEIISRIDAGDGGIIRMPFYADWVSWYSLLPASIQVLVRWISSIDVIIAKSDINRRQSPGSTSKSPYETSSEDDAVVVEKEG